MPFAANIFALVALGTMAGAQSPGAKPTVPDVVKQSVQPPLATPPFAPMAVTYVYTATPQSGSPARLGTVPIGVDWVCDKAGCKTIAAWPQPLVENCAALARQIGPLASYGRSGAMLSPSELDKCNQGIAGAKMIADSGKASSTEAGPQKTETSPKTGSAVEPKLEKGPSESLETSDADPKAKGTDGTEPPSTKETEVGASKAEPEPSTETTSTETPVTENQADSPASSEPAGTVAETASGDEVVPGPTADGAPAARADSGPASQTSSTEGAAPPSGGEAGVEPAAEQSLPTTETALTTPPPVETTASAPSNGVEILVSQLAITGGAQNSLGPRSAMVAITAGELSIVGGAQGAAPQRFEPRTIDVPELSIIGRQGE